MNNCNDSTVKLGGIDRKRAEATRQNISRFVDHYGKRTGVLTITFVKDLDVKSAQRKIHSFKTGVLSKHFGESISVREFTKRGRPHFHLVIDCNGDIATGYNWEHHDRVTQWSKEGRRGPKPKGSLNRSELLTKLHHLLNEKRSKYGLGRMELVPVKNPDAIGFYLGGYLAKSLSHKPADAKGTRAVNYSHKCPRRVRGTFAWANAAGWLWRAKVKEWCRIRGWESEEDVPRCMGTNWMYQNREAILATPLKYWPTIEHAKRDAGFSKWDIEEMGPNAIDIQITSSRTLGDTPGGKRPNILMRFLHPRSFLHVAFREPDSEFEVVVLRDSLFLSITSLHKKSQNVNSASCDSSQALRGDPKTPPKAMFPLEEGSEGKRGFPLQTVPLGESQKMDTRKTHDYWLDEREESIERAGRILYGHNPF